VEASAVVEPSEARRAASSVLLLLSLVMVVTTVDTFSNVRFVFYHGGMEEVKVSKSHISAPKYQSIQVWADRNAIWGVKSE